MRRLALLFAGFAILVTGIVVASFASTTKAETRSALTHVGTLAWRLAVASLVFALSLTPAGCLTESNGERDAHGVGYPYYSRDGVSVAFTVTAREPEIALSTRTGAEDGGSSGTPTCLPAHRRSR